METNSRPSQCDIIERVLRKHAGQRVSVLHLAEESESINVHSRISELRHKRGLHIENTQETVEGSRVRRSFYTLHLPESETTTPCP